MNWNQILALFDGQGLVFWGAVAAVTLGLTLLSVSIVFQVRKMLAGRTWRRGRPGAAGPGAPITVTEDGYRADVYVPGPREDNEGAAPEAPDAAPGRELPEHVLARLRTAADRLDRIHSTLRPRAVPGEAGDSGLKPGFGGVDYVYKSGQA